MLFNRPAASLALSLKVAGSRRDANMGPIYYVLLI
jgi:hypothetical protein